MQQYHINGLKVSMTLLFTDYSKDKEESLALINIFSAKRSPFTVNRLAAVSLIHKLVKMTVHFCFHDTATQVTSTKLHMSGNACLGNVTRKSTGCCDLHTKL